MQANEQFIESNTKACPRCRVPIEKNGEGGRVRVGRVRVRVGVRVGPQIVITVYI